MNEFNKYLAYITGFNLFAGLILLLASIGSVIVFLYILPILFIEFILGLILLIFLESRVLGQALILSSIIALIVGLGVCSLIISMG